MIELDGDIWDAWEGGGWITVTTNGATRKDGACVMGRGVALEAKTRFPALPYDLGTQLKARGNQVYGFERFRIVTLPVKHHWKQQADLDLIEKSLRELVAMWQTLKPLFMVRPGCGNGGLDWETEVKPLLEQYLDNRFIIMERK